MQRLRLISSIFTAVLALSAIMAATASAKPVFNPSAANAIEKGVGGKGELLTLGKTPIACGANTVTGLITGLEEGVIKDIDFTKCKALETFAAKSLGDPSETILTGEIKFKLCYIKEAVPVEVGLYLEGINAHVEVPLAGILINVTGSLIGKTAPINMLKKGIFTVSFAQTAAGDQTPLKCTLLGKELKALLLASKDAKHEKTESASIVGLEEITFKNEVEIKA